LRRQRLNTASRSRPVTCLISSQLVQLSSIPSTRDRVENRRRSIRLPTACRQPVLPRNSIPAIFPRLVGGDLGIDLLGVIPATSAVFACSRPRLRISGRRVHRRERWWPRGPVAKAATEKGLDEPLCIRLPLCTPRAGASQLSLRSVRVLKEWLLLASEWLLKPQQRAGIAANRSPADQSIFV